jgi:hypothetical protein
MTTFTIIPARSSLDEVWGMRLYHADSPVHAVKGRGSRITCCGEHFTMERCQQALPVTCEPCLVQLGCLPVEA